MAQGILSHMRSSSTESSVLGTMYLVALSKSSCSWQQLPKFAITLARLRRGLAWLPPHGEVGGDLLRFAAVVGVRDPSPYGDGGVSPLPLPASAQGKANASF